MTGTRDDILENLARIRASIAEAADTAGRDPAEVLLVAAAKTVSVEAVRWVAEAGVAAVGENYVQELRAVHDAVPGVRWHFIGTLQTNSAHHVAALADVVETVAGGRATERLARRAAEAGRTIDVLMEVDYTGSRTGVAPQDAPEVAARIARLEGVALRGLMTLPPPTQTAEEARPWFRRLRDLRDRIQREPPPGGGLEHGDVVGLRGCGAGRRYIGSGRDGAVRSPDHVRRTQEGSEMAGVWKKTLNYLGLVEEDEDFVEEMPEVEPAPVRRMRPQAVREVSADSEGVVRTIPSSARPGGAATGAIHKSEPKRFNEAREVADRFKEGTAVIMNLQSTEDSIARRLVDFASGLVYGLDGKIELVANRVYLLTPADVEVSAEERERLAGGGFYNQF